MPRPQAAIPLRWHLRLITAAVHHAHWDPSMTNPLGTLLSFCSFVRFADPLSSCSDQFPPRTSNKHNADPLRFPF